jgi:pentatricopeptide repeat protein
MINGLVKNCCVDDSIQLFGDMVAQGVRLDSSTVIAVAELQELRVGTGDYSVFGNESWV